MEMIITSIVIILFGGANLLIARKYPEWMYAGYVRGIGWVGLGCGALGLVGGVLMILLPGR